MSVEDDGGEDFLVEGAFQNIDHQIVESLRDSFKPWHKPRKQWIRQYQWLASVDMLLKQLDNPPTKLKYLGLPGDDLLDIRALHDHILPHKIQLQYIGFNAVQSESLKTSELVLAESEVMDLALIDDENSLIIADRIELIADDKTESHRRAKKAAPYHIVNIDLCATMGTLRQYGNRTIFDCIATLVQMQQKTSEPWLLFLTTRTGKNGSGVQKRVQQTFLQMVIKNCRDHQTFREQFERITHIDSTRLEAFALNPSDASEDEFKALFIVGVSKWLIGLVNGAGSVWTVETLDSYLYNVYAETRDMLSTAFLFERVNRQIVDPSGLAKQVVAVDPHASELHQALRALERFSEIQDVDEMLAADPKAYSEVVAQKAKLLGSARYDAEAYLAWVEAGCPIKDE